MLLKVTDFKSDHWRRDFRKVKKKLRSQNIPFTIKKTPEFGTIVYSLWADDEHIDKARNLAAAYFAKKPEVVRLNERVENLANKFGDEWVYALIAIFIVYPKKHPLYFAVALLVILAMVLPPMV